MAFGGVPKEAHRYDKEKKDILEKVVTRRPQ
jgi:hypothetical protein